MRVRVATLNVWNTEGDPRRPVAINHELRRLAPDLIAFQEVVQTPEVRMLDRLLDGLDFRGTHQADIQGYIPPFADRYGGSAVATRWRHRPVEASDVPWATLAVAVELPDLGELLFIAATAAWRVAAEAARERQAMAITDLDARHRRNLPTIIAGDFHRSVRAADEPNTQGRLLKTGAGDSKSGQHEGLSGGLGGADLPAGVNTPEKARDPTDRRALGVHQQRQLPADSTLLPPLPPHSHSMVPGGFEVMS